MPQKYMGEMIRDRAQSYEEYNDLFSNLMAANERDDEGLKLTDEEVAANIFIYLIGRFSMSCNRRILNVLF